jgi:spore coat polysaccharide biosynthesis predicted glycosyltransferase SpsG
MKIFIVTEVNKETGFGHLTRCSSIYHAFEECEIFPEFIINSDGLAANLLKDKRYKIFNWLENTKILLDLIDGADVVLIDSYLMEINLYKAISELVKICVYIDDNKRIDYPKGIIVNGSIHAEKLGYQQKEDVVYLLGNKYILLRKEFSSAPKREMKNEPKSVMLTFGSSDTRNMTPGVLKLLVKKCPGMIKKVLIGKGFNNISEIEIVKDKKTELIYYLDAKKMKEVMLDSDIVISAGGQTINELAAIGTPTVGICAADNQIRNLEGWAKVGFLKFAGWHNNAQLLEKVSDCLHQLKPHRVRKMVSEIGRKYADGLGNKRVVDKILGAIG